MLAACPFPANHGTPGSIREMAESIADLGHDVHVVTYHYGEDIPARGLRVHRITPLIREHAIAVGPTMRRPLYDLQMVFTTLGVIRRCRPHVLHAHGYEAALVGAVCRSLTRTPLIYSAHNTMGDELPSYGFIRPPWLAGGIARLLDAVVPRLADRCLPHSINAARFLELQGLQHRTDRVVNFGIDVDWMSAGDPSCVRERFVKGREPVVLYAGVLDRFQRLDLLLDAIRLVARHYPSVTLLLVTTLPQPQHVSALLAQASRLGIADRVRVTDPQRLENVRSILPTADVAVVPRPAAAGFPIKLLNYMAARRPSVMFRSSASEGIVHRENAMLASSDTAEALAAEILHLLDDRRLREEIGRRGFEFVREHHDRRVIAREVCGSYARVLQPSQLREKECHAFSS